MEDYEEYKRMAALMTQIHAAKPKKKKNEDVEMKTSSPSKVREEKQKTQFKFADMEVDNEETGEPLQS